MYSLHEFFMNLVFPRTAYNFLPCTEFFSVFLFSVFLFYTELFYHSQLLLPVQFAEEKNTWNYIHYIYYILIYYTQINKYLNETRLRSFVLILHDFLTFCVSSLSQHCMRLGGKVHPSEASSCYSQVNNVFHAAHLLTWRSWV